MFISFSCSLLLFLLSTLLSHSFIWTFLEQPIEAVLQANPQIWVDNLERDEILNLSSTCKTLFSLISPLVSSLSLSLLSLFPCFIFLFLDTPQITNQYYFHIKSVPTDFKWYKPTKLLVGNVWNIHILEGGDMRDKGDKGDKGDEGN